MKKFFLMIQIIICMCTQSLSALEKEIDQETIKAVNEIFKKFAQNENPDFVKHFPDENKLVIYEKRKDVEYLTRTMEVVVPLTCGAFFFAIPILAHPIQTIKGQATKEGNQAGALFASGICGLIFTGLAAWRAYEFYKAYQERQNLVPYLTFDLKGLKKSTEYVFSWPMINNIESKKIGEQEYLSGTVSKSGEIHLRSSFKISITETNYLNALGSKLLSLSSNDTDLPIYKLKVEELIESCLPLLGKEKFSYQIKSDHVAPQA